MTDQTPNRAPQEGRRNNGSKTLACWILMALMTVVALQVLRAQDRLRSVACSEKIAFKVPGAANAVTGRVV